MSQIRISGFADEISADFEKQLEVLGRLGFSYMEIRGVNGKGIDTYEASQVKEIKQRLDVAGIEISSLASPIGKIEIGQDFEGHYEHFKQVVELAHILEAPYIRMFSFFMPPNQDSQLYEGEVLERLGKMVSYDELGKIQLLHENEKDIFGDTADRCLRIMQAFEGKGLKMAFDFANFVQCGQDTREAFELLGSYVAYVHIKDAVARTKMIVPAGQGDGQIAPILKALKEQGYDGFLSLEPHLTEFEGLKGLEREGASLKGMRQMDGEEAFETAYRALMDILGKI